jgi:tetratricopeptide (TPR) repeat protein
MKRAVLHFYLLLAALALVCMPLATAEDAAQVVPEVKIVKGPDRPIGPHATNKGVIELHNIMELEAFGNVADAETAYLKYVETYKDQPLALLALAALYNKKGEKEKALEYIAKADKTNPG